MSTKTIIKFQEVIWVISYSRQASFCSIMIITLLLLILIIKRDKLDFICQTRCPYFFLKEFMQELFSLNDFKVNLYRGDITVSSVTQSCQTHCDPMDCRTSGFPVHHQLPKLAQTHVHQVSDAIQQSHPLSIPSPPALSLSQHQGLFQWVHSLRQVAKVLELQLQHQSFQWIFRIDFL